MTFGYGFSLGNPNLPKRTTVASALKALPGLQFWASLDDGFCTIASGKIAAAASRKTSALSLVQADATKQPALATNQIGGLEAGVFAGGQVLPFSSAIDLSGTLALVVVGTITSAAAAQTIIGSVTSGTQRFGLQVGGAGAGSTWTSYAFCGTPTAPAITLPLNTPLVMILEKDASKFQIRMGGVSGSETSHSNATGSANTLVGALNTGASGALNGAIADVMYFNQRIIGDVDAMAALNALTMKLYGIAA